MINGYYVKMSYIKKVADALNLEVVQLISL